MKKLYFVLVLILLPVFSFAELQIKIGDDITFCDSSFWDGKAPQLGTNLIITGGVPPYKYSWSAEINVYGNTYYADYFLDDTTISTPTFKYDWRNQDWETFTLTVTDAENNTATDVIRVRFSLFVLSLGYPIYYKNIGDEIILSDIPISGGIEPYRSFSWSPPDDLLTPNEQTTVCKVSHSAMYSVTVEDAAGCKATNHSCEIVALPAGTIEIFADNDIPFINDGILFWKNADKLPVKINLYSLNGIKIREVYPVTDEYSLKNNVSSIPVLYEIIIKNKRYVGTYILN